MSHPRTGNIHEMVIVVSSSALFDLSESDKVFRELGYNVFKGES